MRRCINSNCCIFSFVEEYDPTIGEWNMSFVYLHLCVPFLEICVEQENDVRNINMLGEITYFIVCERS